MKSEDQAMPSSGEKWGAMLAVGLGIFMATLDMSIINVSLPTLVVKLNTDFPTIQWVILAYVMVLTSLTLGVARLGDMRGKRSLFMTGLVLFTLGSFLCGMAPSVGWLIAFRVLQGVGAVLQQALGTAIVAQVFPASERGKAMGVIGSVVSTGLALGPPVGGLLIGLVGWRAVFLINIPIGLVAVYAARRFIPKLAPEQTGQRFDLVGAMVILVVLVSYALGMTMGQARGFGDNMVGILLITAALGFILFVFVELRVKQPMLDLTLFRNPVFGLNLMMGYLSFIALAGNIVMPFFFELVKGYRTEQVGLLMMVVPVVMGLVAPVSGILSDRFGSRGISLLGLLFMIVGCLSIASMNTEVGFLGFMLRLAPLGLGLGFFQSPNNSAVMGAVPRHRLGVASGLLTLSRTMGHSSGLPLMGAIFNAVTLSAAGLNHSDQVITAPPAALITGLHGTYVIAAGIVCVSTSMAVAAWWLSKRQSRTV